MAICLLFFAFSTILSWNLFGKINANYLFGPQEQQALQRDLHRYRLGIHLPGAPSPAVTSSGEVTDMFNNFIVLPNVIALFALTGMVMASLNEVNKGKQLKV